jgi:hypothetical protein
MTPVKTSLPEQGEVSTHLIPVPADPPVGKTEKERRVCAFCGEPANRLSPAHGAKTFKELRALPLYCDHCNPKHHALDAQWSCLERMQP